MGQRLVLNIKKNDKIIGNAYYHWSAYTNSALAIAFDAMERYEELLYNGKAEEYSNIELASEILYATGAGLTQEAITVYGEELGYYEPAINRNEGLIELTESGINNSLSWAEGIVEIDLTNETIIFDVIWCEGDRNEYEARIKDEDPECTYLKPYDDLETINYDLWLAIPFCDFFKFSEELSFAPTYFISNSKVYSKIEG